MPGDDIEHVVVTGAGGFLGQALVARARAQGLRVTGLTRQIADQTDKSALSKALEKARPDAIVDAAGVTPGAGDVWDNVTLTENMIHAVGALDHAPRLVLAGSAAVFGEGAPQEKATREDDPMKPVSPYGQAKHQAMQCALEAAQSGMDVQTGILFNLMGPGQPNHLAPQVFVSRALATPKGQTYEVGPVGAVRDFMDIRDAADALIALARFGSAGAVTNVATGRATRIEELLLMLKSRLGVGWHSQGDAHDARGDYVCFGDPSRLRSTTGWSPLHDLDTALDQIIAATRALMEQDTRTAS